MEGTQNIFASLVAIIPVIGILIVPSLILLVLATKIAETIFVMTYLIKNKSVKFAKNAYIDAVNSYSVMMSQNGKLRSFWKIIENISNPISFLFDIFLIVFMLFLMLFSIFFEYREKTVIIIVFSVIFIFVLYIVPIFLAVLAKSTPDNVILVRRTIGRYAHFRVMVLSKEKAGKSNSDKKVRYYATSFLNVKYR